MGTITSYSLQIYLSSLTIRDRLDLLDRIGQVYQYADYDSQVARWRVQVGETSSLFLSKRLEWSCINENDIPKLLCPIKEFNTQDFELPGWVIDIEQFQASKKMKGSFYVNNKDIPFSDVLSPLVDYFYSKIQEVPEEFSDKAINDLKCGLLKYLSVISSQSLLEEMSNSELKYQKFVEAIIEDNYTRFFSEYPYLAKLIFVRGRYWLENTSSLFKAFKNDKHLIMKKLGQSPICVTSIKTDLSESHNHGKNVVILETKSNRFVFKHRSVDLEYDFFGFLDYLNTNLVIKQYVPWLIKGADYGWMEYIDQKHCTNATETKNFYIRMGSLLCLHYVLGSTDLHSENLIACGEFPVFIDLETVLNPLINLNNKHLNSLNEHIDIKFGLSVSRAGILPQWLMGPDTNVYNNSSLGGSKKGLMYPSIVWENINTDRMTYSYQEILPNEDKNLVYLDTQYQDPAKFTSEIVKGFTETYKYFLENKNSPSLKKELLRFKNKQVRFVFRATKVYTLLLEYLNHPDYMRSGVIRSIEMDILAKGLLVDFTKKYIFWDVLDDELSQIENNDVPYYSSNTSITSLISTTQELYKNAFQYKPYERLLSLISSLNLQDLAFQTQIIKSSVETASRQNVTNDFQPYKHKNVSGPDIGNIEKTVFEIGERLLKSKITVDNRSTWVSYVSNIISHTYGYKPVGLDIANGNMGVAVFMASLYAYSGNNIYKDSLHSIIQPILDVLSEDWSRQEFLFRFGTGGTTGIASIIYGFTKLYEYTGEPKYLEYAHEFVGVITEDAINKSLRQDVTSGNAGLLLALTKIAELGLSKPQNISTLMSLCFRVIETNGYVNKVFKNWDYQQNKQLLGFSHGSSGILYALSRYIPYKKPSENVTKVISDILSYEEGFFDATELNWPDYRFEAPDLNVVSWCHGATGIGMSRLQLLKTDMFNEESTIDIQRALNKTMQTGAHFLDTLCCGNSGRIDFLLELKGTKFYGSECENYKNWLIYVLTNTYKTSEDFRYFAKFNTDDVNVGFYQGISGIGYELLRTISPDKFNSMLLFK